MRARTRTRTQSRTQSQSNARQRATAPTVLVPIARGSEEMETVIIVDVLRRAGADVTVASIEPGDDDETRRDDDDDDARRDDAVECSRGVRIVPDARLRDLANVETRAWDLIALPGGMPGAANLAKSERLTRALTRQMETPGALVAAMCASPGVVLAPRGMLDGLACTAHPAFVKDLPSDASANGRVVVDGDVVTSRGPGTALEFALALAEKLFGADKAREVAAPMVLPPIDHSSPRVANEWRLLDAEVV
jgi:4-methyl-5(b-hydroxyethyl)-thiazole monophosphate biosynthesis